MTFIHFPGKARDPGRDIDIRSPRIEKLNDDDDELHFGFPVYKHSKRIKGLGFRGTTVDLPSGVSRWTFVINNEELEFNLDSRDYIAPELDDMAFLLYAADGITSSFASGKLVFEPTEYVVVIPAQLLADKGIAAPAYLRRGDHDELILSQCYVAGEKNPYRTVSE
ncbi:hypothetical protein [Luteibacter sp.]|jgi:hypothetical protein|uniref:hypothetical protein n=1 Tax=Luteibacter sp. TaxID=1886636 RepID=UPI002F405A1D